MNLTQLIKYSIEAEESYQKSRLEYEVSNFGEFDHHVNGLKLNGERLRANKTLESYVASLQGPQTKGTE